MAIEASRKPRRRRTSVSAHRPDAVQAVVSQEPASEVIKGREGKAAGEAEAAKGVTTGWTENLREERRKERPEETRQK